MMATYTWRLSHENCEKHNMQHPNADKGTAIKAKVMVTTSLEIAQKVAASWYIVVCLAQVFFSISLENHITMLNTLTTLLPWSHTVRTLIRFIKKKLTNFKDFIRFAGQNCKTAK